MSRKLGVTLIVIALVIMLCVGLVGSFMYVNDLPNRISQHETIVLGQNRLVPGSQAAMRVVVRDSKDAAPLENAAIKAYLQPVDGGQRVEVFSGETDEVGSTDLTFTVPEDSDLNQTLIIETESELGSDTIERPVTITRDYRILLTTDKPIYQPGQVIHLRALALSTFDLVPAKEQDLELTIADGKGNKVFRETLTTSEWGVAATDFQLASEVNIGNYKLTATLGGVTSEKTVTVEHYTLPKFDVNIDTEKSFYMPGEVVRGTLNAAYFFGKTVAEGEVVIEGYTFDFERVVTVELQGTTDEDGNFEFEFQLPDYIAGTDLEGGLGRYYIDARVTDQAAATEVSNKSIPVSGSPLVIEAIPEGGQFRTGVENILYILTSYPDGSPAETELDVNFTYGGNNFEVETGPYGLAEVRITPTEPYQEVLISATDASGTYSERYFYFEGRYENETILLRPDKPAYRVGETMNLTMLASQQTGTAYLDIVREGQTISTRSVKIEDGQAQVAVDLTPDLYGTLQLHAYKILTNGSITRDTRLVVVDNAADLDFSIAAGADSYLPGEDATLDIAVRDDAGAGAQAAIGLAIVDESVFALAEQDPGFAKLYFMLEAELLQPKYELHGFSVPELVQNTQFSDPQLEAAVDGAAQASLAAAVPANYSFSLQANSHDEAINNARQKQISYFATLSKIFFGFTLVVPLAVLAVSGLAARREKRLGRSLGIAFAVIFGLALLTFLVLLVWPHPWADGPLDKLGEFFYWMQYDGQILLGCFGGIAILSLLALIIAAIVERDKALGLMLLITPAFIAFVALAGIAANGGNLYPPDWVALVVLTLALFIPLAFLVRGVSFAFEKKAFPAITAILGGLLMPLLFIGAIVLISNVSTGAVLQNARGFGGEVLVEAMEDDFGAFEMEEAMPAEAPMAEKSGAGENAQSAEAPRLRQYFPETMLWLPDEVTDQNGDLQLEFPVADSITTWRVTALASTQDGRLGSTTAPLLVFQEFFVDLDLPTALTVGDEVSIPVGVFNYLEESQSVSLEVEEQDWFELLDEREKTIEIGANDISVVYFRIKATDFGSQPFQVTAWGSTLSDAIVKNVRVYPDGKQIYYSHSDRLTPGEDVSQTVDIPTEAIAGTQSLTVKIYPGVVSQVVEGLDSILRMPNGCFEQTSSSTYPNVLVLDYLQLTDQAAPEVEFKAEEYINLGYQRLTTFEVPGHPGGFSLFGDPPPDPMLTAYGLQEFNDMSRVHNVDPALIERTALWLLQQQNSDGSWQGVEGFHESGLTNQVSRLPVTAYVVWGLADAGYANESGTQRGVEYLREFSSQADDTYTLALVANALVAVDKANGGDLNSATTAVLDRLAGMAKVDGNSASWSITGQTQMGSYGATGELETTALAGLALIRSNTHPDLANGALTFLVQNKDNFGTWQTTQATIMALKAMIESVRTGAENVNASVTVTLNDGQSRSVEVTPENFDVVQLLTFDDINIGRENVVDIEVTGEGNLMYQISGGYYLPWGELANYPEIVEGGSLVEIDVAYDRTELAVDDTVGVSVTVSLAEGQADSALIDLGIPPGFSVETADLAALVARFDDVPEDYAFATIERFELTGRQIIIYVSNLSADAPLQFEYRLRAKYPLTAQTPASSAYDYYNPGVAGESQPQMLTVVEGE